MEEAVRVQVGRAPLRWLENAPADRDLAGPSGSLATPKAPLFGRKDAESSPGLFRSPLGGRDRRAKTTALTPEALEELKERTTRVKELLERRGRQAQLTEATPLSTWQRKRTLPTRMSPWKC